MRFSTRRMCACVRERAGADLDCRALSGCGFSPIFAPVSRTPLASRRETTPAAPSIPLFRSRRFNPGFSTQFGALHGGLYAPARLTRHIRYTHPLSLSFALLSAFLPRVLPTLRTRTRTHTRVRDTYTRQPAHIPDRLVSCFHPVRPRSLASDRYMPPTPLFPRPSCFLPPSFALSASCSRALLLARSSSLFLYLSISVSLFILCYGLYLSVFFFTPFVTVPLSPRTSTPALSYPPTPLVLSLSLSLPLLSPEREHLPTLLMFPLSVSPSRRKRRRHHHRHPSNPLLQQRRYLESTYVFHPSPSPPRSRDERA